MSALSYYARVLILGETGGGGGGGPARRGRRPADARRGSADGTTGVYCVDGENASFRPIELVYQGEGYALVKPAEGVRDTQTLRSGDQVIAPSGELYDGKVIR